MHTKYVGYPHVRQSATSKACTERAVRDANRQTHCRKQTVNGYSPKSRRVRVLPKLSNPLAFSDEITQSSLSSVSNIWPHPVMQFQCPLLLKVWLLTALQPWAYLLTIPSQSGSHGVLAMESTPFPIEPSPQASQILCVFHSRSNCT